jgi:hypothetical protein
MTMPQDGHLYIQTNEIQNCVIHYARGADGKLTELQRIPTGGAGSGTFKPVSGQKSAPNAFDGAPATSSAGNAAAGGGPTGSA